MSQTIQHLLVLAIVLACVAVVAVGTARTLWGRRSQLGKCCSKGCASETTSKPATERVVFVPSDSLRLRRPIGR